MQIPQRLEPVVKMGITNLVDKGYKVINPEGIDVSDEIRQNKVWVESGYIVWCHANLRNVT